MHDLIFIGAGLLASRTKKELRRLDLHAKKGLGQHFLVEEKALGCIISAAQLTSADTVIEVGPGLGILTEELAKKAGRIIAVEIDSRLALALKETFASCCNVTIINKDILETDAAALLELIGGAGDISYKVVANLPYFIGSAVVRHFMEASIKPCLMVVTVQKEVAQQMAAQPGKMSLLSVGVQFYGKPAIVDYVPASSFYPRPKVDSAIVRIDLYDQPAVQVEDATKFFRVVRGGFSAPRKQLHNSLAQGLEISSRDAAALVERAGISQKRRPETLSLDEWARVYQVCTEEGC